MTADEKRKEGEKPMRVPMRVFVGGLCTETNTFAPFPTGRAGFEEYGIERKAALSTLMAPVAVFRKCAEADGCEVVETISCFAQPSGKTVKAVYEELRDMMIDDLRAAGPVDMVLLMLHGAMVAQGYDDCEGDIIGRVRALVPDGVIGVVLDPHCHMTAAMLERADIIILAKEYPHIDFNERSQELYRLCRRTALGEIRPVAALADTRMVGFYPTFDPPMQDIVADLRRLEQEEKILTASIAHGFPWADVADVGTKVLVYADGDEAAAAEGAERIADRLYAERHALLPNYPSIEEALDRARGSNGQVVLGDFADNPGGGAPGDSTFFLKAMLDRGITDAVIGSFYDPLIAQICAQAGPGAVLDIRLGGKYGPSSGDPVDLTVEVKAAVDKHVQTFCGDREPMGLSVWVHARGIDIVICSVRTQTYGRDAFTGLGITLEGKRLLVVKSSHHYQAEFRPEADHIWNVRTPGAIGLDLAGLPYTQRDLRFFPRVDDPWSEGRPAPAIFRREARSAEHTEMY